VRGWRYATYFVALTLTGCCNVSWSGYGTADVYNARPVSEFEITPDTLPYLNFFAVGDFGTGKSGQKLVAEAMATHASQDSLDFVIGLGDNFYGCGVKGLQDPQWKTKFEDVYANP